MRFSISYLFLISLFLLSPIVDSINGYLIFNGAASEGSAGSIGQLYRFFILIISFLIIDRFLVKFCIFILFFYCYFFEFIGFTIHEYFPGFIVGIVYSSKILFIFIVYFSLKTIEKKGVDSYKIVEFFIYSSLIYSLILIFSTILGINSSTYEGSLGSKGLFASGNGLSIFLGVSSLVCFYYYNLSKNTRFMFIFLIVLLSSIFVGTKASIVFMILGLFFILLKISSKYKFLLTSLAFILFFYFDVASIFSELFSIIYMRYQNSGSIFSFLASSRDIFLQDSINKFYVNGWFLLRLIFGFGVFLSYRDPFSAIYKFDTLESDAMDTFFMYGIVGFSIYVFSFCFLLFKFIKKKDFILFVATFCLFGYSFLAGHVLFNAMSSMAISILFFIGLNDKFGGKV